VKLFQKHRSAGRQFPVIEKKVRASIVEHRSPAGQRNSATFVLGHVQTVGPRELISLLKEETGGSSCESLVSRTLRFVPKGSITNHGIA